MLGYHSRAALLQARRQERERWRLQKAVANSRPQQPTARWNNLFSHAICCPGVHRPIQHPCCTRLVGVGEAQRAQRNVAQRNVHAVRCRPRRHNKLRLPHCLEGVQQRHTGGQAQQLQEQTRGMGSKGMRRGCSLTEGSMPCSLADSMACLRLFQSDWIYRSATTARFKMHAAHLGSHLPDLLLGRHVAHVVSCCSRAWKIASNHQIQHASSMGDSAASPSVRASHRVALLSQTMCLSTATHFMHACAGPT